MVDIVERLRIRIHTSEDETALTNDAADEIERLRVLLKNVVGAWDAWDIQTDDGSGFMNLEDVIDTARSALQQKGIE